MPESTTPVSYRAIARRDGTVVADSTDTVRVDHDDSAPDLWFPAVDVDLTALPGDAWRSGVGTVAGLVSFDLTQVQVDLIDGQDGEGEREVTTKRFPTWGDAVDLVAVLDVRPDGEGRFTGPARSDWRRPVVEGSQILGQAIVAAGRHSPGRAP